MAEYIEKQAAIGAIYERCAGEHWEDILRSIPPADVRPVVRGEWKHLGGDEWCCDQCGHVISTEGSWEHPLNDRSIYFCPNCGADMRGGDSD